MWQPIETAPKDDADVLIWTGTSCYVATWAYDDRWQPDGLPSMEPTHWMPLPEPPDDPVGRVDWNALCPEVVWGEVKIIPRR